MRFPSLRTIRLKAEPWLATLLLLGGCSPGADSFDVAIDLIAFVPHQRHQVSTDLISAVEPIGLDRLEFGFAPHTDLDPAARHLELTAGVGRIDLFSADADLTRLELEAGLDPAATDRRLTLVVRLNGRRIARLSLEAGSKIYEIDVPARLVLRGRNRLEMQARVPPRETVLDTPPMARIRRIRPVWATDRPLWPAAPGRIEAVDESSAGDTTGIRMPTSSYLDMVLEVPAEASLVGRYSLTEASDRSTGPVDIYARLLDAEGAEQTLISESLHDYDSRATPFRIDLSPWRGGLVRLRFGVTGAHNAVVNWQGVSVIGDADPPLGPQPRATIGREPAPRSGRLGRPDVLVILLDAARADAFSPFGGEYPTPALERLADDGTKLTRAISTAPWTGQSVPSILTGLFADTLGIGGWGSGLPPDVSTLAEMMSEAGYRTVLWSQHPFYRNRSGLQRGFEEFVRAPRSGYDWIPPSDLLVSEDRPTFAWVHFIPPHTPYRPPAPFLGSYSSWYEGGTSVEASFLSRFPHRIRPETLSPDDLRYIRDRYMENAAFADDLVGRVLDGLAARGRYESTLIVVLSDHGEAFLEHDRFMHTRHVYREYLHVPWILKWPAGIADPAPVVDSVVPLVDLVPTLVDGLGLEAAESRFHGRSLLPVVFDRKPRAGATYASTRGDADRSKPPHPEAMLEIEEWRIVYSPLLEDVRLFRPQDDPREQNDLAEQYPLQALRMRQAVRRQMEANRRALGSTLPEPVAVELDAEEIEQLRALGYLD